MTQRCEACPTIRDCKTAFGRYWEGKSGGGVGCDHPFSYVKGGDRGKDAAEQNGESWSFGGIKSIKQEMLI